MASALNSAQDYAGAISALTPRGAVWPKDPSSTQQQVIAALAQAPERVDAAAQGVLVDAFPASSVNLLTEWEESTGLLASDLGLSTPQRQAAVVAQLTEVGGQSQADMIAYAATLGATITIMTYAPARCGIAGCGDLVGGADYAFAWSIHIVTNTGALTSAQVLTAMQAVAPAETTVFLA